MELVEMVNVIKKTYCKLMNKFYSKQKCSGPWTRKWISDIKEMINNGQDINLSKEWSPYQTTLKDMYIVGTNIDNTQLMRILKSSRGKINIVPVMPWEDSFDIIWAAHIACQHGNLTQTMNLLKSNYFLNPFFVETVIKTCYCEKVRNPIIMDYNIKGSIQVLDMTTFPDKSYKYILTYVDIGTGFIQLKPIKQVNELEISLELIEIFTDLGPPRIVVVYEPYFYDNVIHNLNKVFSPCKIELEFESYSYESSKVFYARSCQVCAELNNWMKENNTKSWRIGCHLVQLKMNVSPYKQRLPHQVVFGDTYTVHKLNTKNKVTSSDISAESPVVLDEMGTNVMVLENSNIIGTPIENLTVLDDTLETCDKVQTIKCEDPVQNETYINIDISEDKTKLVQTNNSKHEINLDYDMNVAGSSNKTIKNKYSHDIIFLPDQGDSVYNYQTDNTEASYSGIDSEKLPSIIKIEISTSDEELNSD